MFKWLVIAVITLTLATSCGKNYIGHMGQPGAPGDQGPKGEQGPAGSQGPKGDSAIAEVIDPCGDNAGADDEVLLKLNNGTIIGMGKKGKNFFLMSLGDGTYETRDAQECEYTIGSGEVSW